MKNICFNFTYKQSYIVNQVDMTNSTHLPLTHQLLPGEYMPSFQGKGFRLDKQMAISSGWISSKIFSPGKSLVIFFVSDLDGENTQNLITEMLAGNENNMELNFLIVSPNSIRILQRRINTGDISIRHPDVTIISDQKGDIAEAFGLETFLLTPWTRLPEDAEDANALFLVDRAGIVQYCALGGMPGVSKHWCRRNNNTSAQEIRILVGEFLQAEEWHQDPETVLFISSLVAHQVPETTDGGLVSSMLVHQLPGTNDVSDLGEEDPGKGWRCYVM